jgi:methionyl-tRNA synthetase
LPETEAGQQRDAIVFYTYEALRYAATLLYPVTPELSASALGALGCWPADADEHGTAIWRSELGLKLLSQGTCAPGTRLHPSPALVAKIQVDDLAAVLAPQA